MISKEDLIVSGLNIETRNALDFVVFKTGNATKLFQRNLKAQEKDTLTDIQDRLEAVCIFWISCGLNYVTDLKCSHLKRF